MIGDGEPAFGIYPEGVDVRTHLLDILRQLHAIAESRGQTLSQLALAWALRHPAVATAVIGMSSPQQVDDNADAVQRLDFTTDERQRIARILPPRWGMP